MHIKHIRLIVSVIGLSILAVAIIIMVRQTFNKEVPTVVTVESPVEERPFSISSPVFDVNGQIPNKYICGDPLVSPPLSVQGTPENTKELALVMRDITSPDDQPVTWLMWKISPDTTQIQEGQTPNDSLLGKNYEGAASYGIPCPADDTQHTYLFELYALDEPLGAEPDISRDAFLANVNGKFIGKAELRVNFTKPSQPPATN